jgi:hypothetical protein
LCALLSDRAEQQPEEAAASTRAEHEELSAPREFDQRLCGRALSGHPFDLEPVDRFIVRPPERVVDEIARVSLDRPPELLAVLGEHSGNRHAAGGSQRGFRGQDVWGLVCVDEPQARAAQVRLRERPAQRGVAARRAIDADDDGAHGRPGRAYSPFLGPFSRCCFITVRAATSFARPG